MKRGTFLKSLGLALLAPKLITDAVAKEPTKIDLRKHPLTPEECYLPQFITGDQLFLMKGYWIVVVSSNYLNNKPEITCVPENMTIDLGSGCGCRHTYKVSDVPAIKLWKRPYNESTYQSNPIKFGNLK